MASELIAQREIKESVIGLGGFAIKLSNRFTIGVPDLGIWLPTFAPVVAEVKDLGVCVDTFDRDLGVTPKQADMMRRMQKPYEGAVTLLLIHILHRGERRLVALPSTATRLQGEGYGPLQYDIRRKQGIKYPCLSNLFDQMGVPRI